MTSKLVTRQNFKWQMLYAVKFSTANCVLGPGDFLPKFHYNYLILLLE